MANIQWFDKEIPYIVQNKKIITTSSTQNVSSNNNNFIRYSDGILIQWGHTHMNRDSNAYITFSYPFIDANYSIVVLDGDNNAWSNAMNGFRLDGAKAGTELPIGKTSTKCRICKYGEANDFDWIAIGRWE